MKNLNITKKKFDENQDSIEIDTGLKGNKAYEILKSVIG